MIARCLELSERLWVHLIEIEEASAGAACTVHSQITFMYLATMMTVYVATAALTATTMPVPIRTLKNLTIV